MMRRTTPFGANASGSLRETTALIAAAISILGVGAAMGLNRLTSEGSLPHIAIIMPDSRFAERISPLPAPASPEGAHPALDYMPVASIPGPNSRPIILNPCDGSQKVN